MKRRVEYRHGLQISVDENIAVIDSGCDQCIISNNSFVVKSYSGVYYSIRGALNGMISNSTLELVSQAYVLLVCPYDTTVLVVLHQVLLDRDPGQTETLLQPHQIRANGVIVDDVPLP